MSGAARHIAFLRAINVGGRTVKKDVLAKVFRGLGFQQVETFIASGNVVFHTKAGVRRALEARIEKALHKELGYEVATFVRTADELAAVACHEAFRLAAVESALSLNVAFLSEPLGPDGTARLMKLKTPVDDFHVHGREMYWLCKVRQSESEFANVSFEKIVGVKATFRGINTVRRMADKFCGAR